MTAAPLTALRVLLIDDDGDQLALTQAMLEDDPLCEFDVDWAPTFEDGLARLAERRYDAALVDYRLGARTGVEILHSDTFRRASVPAVMLTGDADPDIDEGARAAGAVDYLVKHEVTASTLKRALRYATERHRVTALLEQRAASLRAILEDSTDVVLLLDRQGSIMFASGSAGVVDGFDSAELIGRDVLDRVHPDDLESLRGQLENCAGQVSGRCATFEYRQQHRDGSWRDREAVVTNRLDEPGIAAIVFTYRDVTSRNAVHAQQAHLATIVASSDDAIYSRTLGGMILSWNSGAERLLGYTAPEALGRHVTHFFSAESVAASPRVFDQIRNGDTIRQLELVCIRKDGASVPVSLTISPLRDRDGRVVGASAVARDITERQAAQRALADSEAEHRATFDDAPVGMAQTALDGRWLRVNRCLQSMLGFSTDELQATTFAALTHPDDVDHNSSGRIRLLEGVIDEYCSEKRYRRKDGTFLWVNLRVSLHRDPSGAPAHFIAVAEDISERKQAQLGLDHIFNLSPDMIATANLEGYFTRVNPAWRQMLGYGDDALMARPFLSFVHPDDQAATLAAMAQLGTGTNVFGFTNRYVAADGSCRWLEWHAKVDLGTKVIYAVARDQTARRLLEEQFRQAQKMEAVGRLAGGVAHDFNNLLTAIIGFSELALSQLPDGVPLRNDVAQILNAGQSAASLTKQLLAFSRKQILQPQVLDVAALIGGMHSLLRRVIGEDISLELAAAEGVHRICADRGQLEQVVMNLAVNARDAMPSGGTLRIFTDAACLDEAFVARHAGATAGPHVRVTMSDTGIGMGPDVLAHLFEPFFTTKEQGKGTGLGLATVYGVVKQSGGYISVDSIQGVGTSFTLHFPVAAADSAAEHPGQPATQPVAGSETIMVVEDQEEVRAVVCQALRARGYRVIEAANGPLALTLLSENPGPLDLLLTDVVMPQMSGRDLAERAAVMRRGVRVLYMSGYTDDAIVHHGVLEPDIAFLPKPFTPAQLLEKVRQLLDRPSLNGNAA